LFHSSGFFERVMAQARVIFNIKIPSVWDGDYDFGAPFPDLLADKDLLKERIEALHGLSSRDFFIDMVCDECIARSCLLA
jgi:hypothetical protein